MTFQKLFSLLKANDSKSQRKVNQDKRAVKAASAAVVTSFTTLSTPFAMLVVMLVIMLDMMHLKL